jgi:hypothetical protein
VVPIGRIAHRRGDPPGVPAIPVPCYLRHVPGIDVVARRATGILDIRQLADAVAIGVGATLTIDLWALLLKRAFGIPSLDYRLLGRWLLGIPSGTFVHDNIAAAPGKRFEGAAGWAAHYLIGTSLSVLFLLLVADGWMESPTPLPALAYGIATVLAPFLILQPALGLGIASSRSPRPGRARLKSLATHTVFGLGLYGGALLAALARGR